MFNDMQRTYNIIAILISKLGGEVTITESELQDPPVATVTTNHATGELKFTVEK